MRKTIKGDITKIKVDAIVNAANNSLLGGSGVDGSIHKAAGPGLLEECKKIGGCPTGEARITESYNIGCKKIIHTVGPVWMGGKQNEAEQLASSYWNSLVLAKEHGLNSVAFPNISTGAYGFPKREAAEIAISTAQKFLNEHAPEMDVIFVCYDEMNYFIYQDICPKYQSK